MMVATSSTLHEPLGQESSPSKLIEDSSASENVNLFQAIIRFDDRIKVWQREPISNIYYALTPCLITTQKLFIDPVKKEFSAVASQVIAEEMRAVRKTYTSGRDHADEAVATPASTTTAPDSSNGQ
ncbi:unnamed protein product [Phytophthora fragariaefolia]|uniref:Unnamed protein product n=1 Tax=Phytophthora fragariaefolia TaxID=1490495 RepID=A0A9W6TUX9_9STRA|nr:unnamed protein product [Phytophthora fragariaefolia]